MSISINKVNNVIVFFFKLTLYRTIDILINLVNYSTSASILNTTNSSGSTVFGAGPITPSTSAAVPSNIFLNYFHHIVIYVAILLADYRNILWRPIFFFLAIVEYNILLWIYIIGVISDVKLVTSCCFFSNQFAEMTSCFFGR